MQTADDEKMMMKRTTHRLSVILISVSALVENVRAPCHSGWSTARSRIRNDKPGVQESKSEEESDSQTRALGKAYAAKKII